ncbi:putative SCF ubiquitin ligase complex subunit [Clavispora lusitaniae]|uniref:SCF ubiquitin ligase complex subunit n=1 Tax=Clavispora lusitaniae TaxID=36911 RepID=A0AA91PZK7_CLALS|nr:putative SCF ubiquitin ligase complex subunit [Clavispora lusitaniae]
MVENTADAGMSSRQDMKTFQNGSCGDGGYSILEGDVNSTGEVTQGPTQQNISCIAARKRENTLHTKSGGSISNGEYKDSRENTIESAYTNNSEFMIQNRYESTSPKSCKSSENAHKRQGGDQKGEKNSVGSEVTRTENVDSDGNDKNRQNRNTTRHFRDRTTGHESISEEDKQIKQIEQIEQNELDKQNEQDKQNSQSHEHEPYTPHINDLPHETLVDIFAHLTPMELRELRLVCRKWNSAVSDKAAWTQAFRNQLGTPSEFASVTGSRAWLAEYFGRVARLRQWTKAKARAHSYSLVNGEYGPSAVVEMDFAHDRLATISPAGSLASCALVSGKNQVFVPGSAHFAAVSASDASGALLGVGTRDGVVWAKNLASAQPAQAVARPDSANSAHSANSTHSAHSADPVEIVSVRVRRQKNVRGAPGEMVALDAAGQVRVFSASALLRSAHLGERAFCMDTDFERIVVVTAENVHVLAFSSLEPLAVAPHGWTLDAPPHCHVDFAGSAVALVHGSTVRVLREQMAWAYVEAQLPANVVHTALQMPAGRPQDARVAGGDGRLLAAALDDGSVAVFNVRARGALRPQCLIAPFHDARAPRGLEARTKVAVDSCVVVVAAAYDWVHFYDAHSGRYLREGTAAARRGTRHGTAPVSAVALGPSASGVVVCSDVVQHFSFGAPPVQRPSTPAGESTSRRARQHTIRTQLDDWAALRHAEAERARLADKYNGTDYVSEDDELRTAMALSASDASGEDAELLAALALSRQDESSPWQTLVSPEGTSASAHGGEDDEEEILRRVLELSLLEH